MTRILISLLLAVALTSCAGMCGSSADAPIVAHDNAKKSKAEIDGDKPSPKPEHRDH